ncbi:MAG: NADPH-dependent FMN reductase, partial [Erysipelotrichaceae bacterium]
MAKVLFIVGSLRKESFNMQMAKEAEKFIGEKAEVSYLEYSDIPYMNQDIEFPAPLEIQRVRNEVKEADGIWIFTPEYNGNIPGVLKNLLDWLSRPLAVGDLSTPVTVGKTVTISSAAGKSAGAGVRASLAKLLTMMRTNLIMDEGTGVSLNKESFASGTAVLTDENIEA